MARGRAAAMEVDWEGLQAVAWEEEGREEAHLVGGEEGAMGEEVKAEVAKVVDRSDRTGKWAAPPHWLRRRPQCLLVSRGGGCTQRHTQGPFAGKCLDGATCSREDGCGAEGWRWL